MMAAKNYFLFAKAKEGRCFRFMENSVLFCYVINILKFCALCRGNLREPASQDQSNSDASRKTTSLFFCQMDGNSRMDRGQAPLPTSRVMHGIFLL